MNKRVDIEEQFRAEDYRTGYEINPWALALFICIFILWPAIFVAARFVARLFL